MQENRKKKDTEARESDWMRTPWQSTKRPERAACKTREIEHAEKKFANENEKPAEEGKPIPREGVQWTCLARGCGLMRMRLRNLKNLKRSTEKAAIKRNEASEKLVEAIDRPEEKMRAFKL